MKKQVSSPRWLAFFLFIQVMFICGAYAETPTDTKLVVTHSFEKSIDPQIKNWQILLEFNQPVQLKTLKDHIELKFNGSEIPFSFKKSFEDVVNVKYKTKDSSFLGIFFSDSKLKSYDKIVIVPAFDDLGERDYRVTVKKDLTDASGKYKLQEDYTIPFKVATSFTISQIYTYPNFSSYKRHIEIIFTDDCNDLRQALQITPAVRINWYRSKLYGKVARLYGNFEPDKQYFIKFTPAFKSLHGRKYVKTINQFKFPDYELKLIFTNDNSVVEKKSRQMIHTSLMNVEELLVKSTRIPPISIPFLLLKSKKLFDLDTEDVKSTLGKLSPAHKILAQDPDFRFLAISHQEDTQVFFPQFTKNQDKEFSIPLTFRENPEQGGCFLVELSSNKKDSDAQAINKVFRITDLSISYKSSPKNLLVWITSLNTGKPVSGVRIFAMTHDKYIVLLGKTNNDGVLLVKNEEEFKIYEMAFDVANPFVNKKIELSNLYGLIAVDKNDVSYILNNEGYIKPKEIKISRTLDTKDSFYKGHLFTERGVYRPGEIVHFKGTLREYKKGEILLPGEKECIFLIKNSKGEVVFKEAKKLSEFGTAAGTFQVKSYYPLGRYTLFMRPTTAGKKNYRENDDYARITFQVQEFRPPRHFAQVLFETVSKPSKDYVGIDKEEQFLKCTIEGKYYTGGIVQNGQVRWKVYYTATDFKVPGYEDYTFGHPTFSNRELLETGESMLDNQGRLTFQIPLSQDILSGMYGLQVVATVLDIDGRPTNVKDVYQHKPDYLVGISRHPQGFIGNEKQELKVVVFDKDYNKVKEGTIRVTALKESHTYVQKRNVNGGTSWEYKKIWQKDFSTNISLVDSKAVFNFDFARGGKFLLRFSYRTDDGLNFSSGTEYNVEGPNYYRYHYYNSQSGNISLEKMIYIRTEKPSFEIGEDINFYLSTSLNISSCLLTVEREGVLEYKLVKVEGDISKFSLPAKDAYFPNAYISVLGTIARGEFPVYGAQQDDEAPSYVFGCANIEINKNTEELSVSIANPEEELKAEPGQEVTLDISVKDSQGQGVVSEMAVFVVDEGILALTDYKTPKLNNLINYTSPLIVQTMELRNILLLQTPYALLRNEPLTGGGGRQSHEEAFTTKNARKDFNPVAYFNPSVITGENGSASVSFKFPDTLTSYRVCVVACDKGGKFASSDRQYRVSKDFYLEPGIPRFMTKGDKAKFLIPVFNKTDAAGALTFSAKTNEKIEMVQESNAYNINGNSRTIVPLLSTAKDIGEGELSFAANFNDMKDAVNIKLPVNWGMPIENRAIFGKFKGSEKIKWEIPETVKSLALEEKELVGSEFQAWLQISGSPFLQLSEAVNYLLQYPYGCIEQTSSRVIALAALQKTIKDGQIPLEVSDAEKYLTPGIERILSMQTNSGGFGYWPGNIHPHRWGSIYAMTALTLAKESGAEVPEDVTNKGCQYLEGEINKNAQECREFTAYASWILAKNNKLKQTTYQVIIKDEEKLSQEAQLILLWAAKLSNFEQQDVLAEKLSAALKKQASSGRCWGFYAPNRRHAVALLVSGAILGSGKTVDEQAGKVIAGITPKGIWKSTSDTGWCLFALGEYFKGVAASKEPISLLISQSGLEQQKLTIEPGKFESFQIKAPAFLKTPEIDIQNKNKDQLVTYKLFLKYPRKDYGKKGYSNGFKVEKYIENMRAGKPIRVGDVVKVKVRVTVEGEADYVVLDDPLPAGLVAINSALKTEEASPGASYDADEYKYFYWDADGFYNFVPNFFEIKDDRVLAFKDYCYSGVYQYSYYARAICEGEFVMPSTKIQQMYEPGKCAFSPQSVVKIEALPLR